MDQNSAAKFQSLDDQKKTPLKECILLVGSISFWSEEVQKQIASSNPLAHIYECSDEIEIKKCLDENDIALIVLQVKSERDLPHLLSVVTLAKYGLVYGVANLILVTPLRSHPLIQNLEKKGIVQILNASSPEKAIRVKADYSLTRMRVILREHRDREAKTIIRAKAQSMGEKLRLVRGEGSHPIEDDSPFLINDNDESPNWGNHLTPDADGREWGNHLSPDGVPLERSSQTSLSSNLAQNISVQDVHPSLVLISSREQDFKLIETFSRSIPSNIHFFPKVSTDILRFLNRYPQSLVFWDVDHEKAAEQKNEGSIENVGLMLSKAGNPTHIFAISDDAAVKIPYLKNVGKQVYTHNLLRKDNESAIKIYTHLIQAAHTGKALGLENYFSGDNNSRRQQIKLHRASHRSAAIGATQSFLSKQGLYPRLATLVSNAIEELLLNALFCAPVDENGEHYRLKHEKTEDFALNDREQVQLAVMSNNEYFGVTVTDKFGSMNPERVLRNLQHNFDEDGYTPDGQNQTGLGLRKVVESGFSLLMVSDPNRATEVTIFFPVAQNHRDFRTRFRFLSAIWKN